MPAVDIVATAAALYAAPLARFTAERTARARAARADGDRDLAARITALPKPSAAAWLVNLLAREDPDDLDRLLELGSRLRAAQDDADRSRLRELGAERRALLAAITDVAGDRSAEGGRRAGVAVLEEVQQTLQAALVSEEAAGAIRSGRLVRSLRAEGLDPVDLSDAVALGGQAAGKGGTGDRAADGRRTAEQRLSRAEEAEQAARAAARQADASAADAEEAVRDRADAAEALRTELERLRARVDDAEAALAVARHAAEQAGAEALRAARAVDDARRAADEAQDDLRRLST